MLTAKVLPKGQITLPKEIRKKLDIHEGDTLIIERTRDEIVLKKGKTLYDFRGSLPDIGMSIDELREKALEEGVKDFA
jgi:AbrB family looped-hinge helix DNA binding protein